MKKITFLSLLLLLLKMSTGYAQVTTAKDFNMNDCSGNMHHLYEELNTNDVVIIEFMMLNCASCVTAANAVYPMYQNIKNQYGNRVRYYLFGFQDNQPAYSCSNISNWATTNGFNEMVPFDSGAVQVAYYGGMGMPTISILAGTQHKVLYNNEFGISSGDTTDMGKAIRDFLKNNSPLTIHQAPAQAASFMAWIDASQKSLRVKVNVNDPGLYKLSVFNIMGAVVQEYDLGEIQNGQQEAITQWMQSAGGVYTINLTKNNNLVATQKIVLEN